ncbi:hypothetical protein [Saccharothrix sp. ST-888]|uniref:hypothetical protein n=1 Tax=Saccharothrix sp. ST-888 TaxID=1427391 RepID=UPI0005ED03D7|nr:hypothetical protein [Saccharothrix sp. ST-888]KJK56106.1 hypothetical protein UK12_24510 [Saccharothrix sp. ST-888]
MPGHSIEQQPEQNLLLVDPSVSLTLGVSNVTEKNWEKVFIRLQIAKQLGLINESAQHPFTPELVRRHIGARLGVFEFTDATWRTEIFKRAAKPHADFLDAWADAQ